MVHWKKHAVEQYIMMSSQVHTLIFVKRPIFYDLPLQL